MHQQPPKIPLCFSTRRANAGQVFGESGAEVRGRGPEGEVREAGRVREIFVRARLDFELGGTGLPRAYARPPGRLFTNSSRPVSNASGRERFSR